MGTTTLSSKGQVIIPKSIRDSHHWLPGTEFVIEETAEGIILKTAKPFQATDVEKGLGCTGYVGSAHSVEEMDEAVAARIARDWSRER
ncbi:MAG: AbrB/MazE/SpoVT family DNA-binding domain-containing protein [Nitrospirae bacterium]|nr:AbrB/MazE/SpoVT family DNA-binding domain-containing protein [Nitrospirota bacterium]